MAESASFASFIKETREKKKNEALAQQFLGSRGRKGSAPATGSLSGRAGAQKPTLLSRMSGVQKQRSSSARPAANIEGKWEHDLHKVNNPRGPPPQKLNRTASASQIDRNTRTYDRLQSHLGRNAQNVRTNSKLRTNNNVADSAEISIRGVAAAGPCTLIASNFASGTTAADIEAVMAPHGGEMVDCRVVVSNPTVMAEITFATKEGAENVISVFNNKKADGKVLYVYNKAGPSTASLHTRPSLRATQVFDDDMDVEANGGAHNGSFSDGRYGFNDNGRPPPRGPRRRF